MSTNSWVTVRLFKLSLVTQFLPCWLSRLSGSSAMPLNDADSELNDQPEFVQLKFPFQVQRIELPPEPNRYSLAPDSFQEGGGFFYENCPEVFLSRTGYGPLRMAWDTNILIDYADFGDLMWDEHREFDPPISEPRYRDELIALDQIMQLWVMRDIRVRVPHRQIFDAQRELDEAKWELRERQVHHFLAALQCIDLDTGIIENVQPFDVLPEGSTSDEWDASLVLEAIETGCHLFLTRDGRLRRRFHRLTRESFVVIMSPSELCQALEAADELGFGGDGYVLPDNHKWLHFMRATKRGEDAT